MFISSVSRPRVLAMTQHNKLHLSHGAVSEQFTPLELFNNQQRPQTQQQQHHHTPTHNHNSHLHTITSHTYTITSQTFMSMYDAAPKLDYFVYGGIIITSLSVLRSKGTVD